MRYYLKIGETEFPNVSDIQINGKYRKENVQTALSGDLLIDRIGTEKITIKAKINMLSTAELNAIMTARDVIFCEVTFDRGAERLTKTMHILDFSEPSPIYLFGDKEKGIVYNSITITAEEK